MSSVRKKIIKINYLSLVLLSFSFLVACSSVTRKDADWSYQKNAITLNLKADKSLNVYDGYSHALTVAIAQVSSPDNYLQILKTNNGLKTAITNEKKIKGQTSFNRIYLQPGETKNLVLDRALGSEYVYLFFGYADGILEKNSYLIPIPLDDTPQPLNIKIEFGPRYILSIDYSQD